MTNISCCKCGAKSLKEPYGYYSTICDECYNAMQEAINFQEYVYEMKEELLWTKP